MKLQILEYYAELASKSENLENFLMGCLHNTISEFKKISQGCRATLDARIRGGIKRINAQRNDSYDVEILSRMSAANVDFKDPEFHRRCSKSIYVAFNLTPCILFLTNLVIFLFQHDG